MAIVIVLFQGMQVVEYHLKRAGICIAVRDRLIKDSGVATDETYDKTVEDLLKKKTARGMSAGLLEPRWCSCSGLLADRCRRFESCSATSVAMRWNTAGGRQFLAVKMAAKAEAFYACQKPKTGVIM
jgi:hypothetical protein